jgi:4-amino-4-deoxy-L-arabinose transferase-like glycosyltransferase
MRRAVRIKRQFRFWLAFWTGIGLLIRLASVLGRLHRLPRGDTAYFYGIAKLLVQGKGFINPFILTGSHRIVQTASFPPLWVFLLAIPNVLGFHSFFASRILACLVGAAGIAMSGIAGREIGGQRVGLIVAFLMAVYPNVWDNAEIVAMETLTPLLIGLILYTTYRFWRDPSMRNAVYAGLALGVAALGRDELALLVPLIFIPLALGRRQIVLRRRIVLAAVGAGVSLLTVLPWITYNMTRFQDATFISSGLGTTLASANCNQTYHGQFIGYWSYPCQNATGKNPLADESYNNLHDEKYALHYVRTHLGRLPVVEVARIGRGFGFFRPRQQIIFDWFVETRPWHWAFTGLYMYYVLFALSIGGAFVLRRRRVLIYPLLMIGVDVVFSMMLTFGQTRYRAPFESSLVILAAVQLDWLWGKLWRRKPASAVHGESEAVDADAPTRALTGILASYEDAVTSGGSPSSVPPAI